MPVLVAAATTRNVRLLGDQVFVFADDGCLTMMDVGNEKYYEISQEDWQDIMRLITG